MISSLPSTGSVCIKCYLTNTQQNILGFSIDSLSRCLFIFLVPFYCPVFLLFHFDGLIFGSIITLDVIFVNITCPLSITVTSMSASFLFWQPKTVNAFQRVKIDDVKYADERLQDNSYWAKVWLFSPVILLYFYSQ